METVHIYRPVINHEEIFEHYSSQPHLKRIVRPNSLRISLAHTMRQFDHDTISKDLKDSYTIIEKNSSRQHITFGRQRVFSLEVNSAELLLRQSALDNEKITFFEIENFRPHIALDFNLDQSITEDQIKEIEPFTNRIYLDGEILTNALQNYRNFVEYRKIKGTCH